MFSILDHDYNTLGIMDNSLPGAIHFFDDEFHQYLSEGGSTFDFTVFKDHDDTQYLIEGHYVHFMYKDRDYLMTIRRTEEDEFKLTVFTESLNLDLLNEYAPAYSAPSARKITAYLGDILTGSGVSIGLNEVSSFERTLSWEGQSTVLERVLSIVNYFDAECEFVTIMNDDLTLDKIQLNIYRKYSETTQGVGEDRTDIELRYGENVNTIRRTVDITELYTAIRPIGTDGTNIKTRVETIKDDSGNVLFYTKSGSEWIYAPYANAQFGSSQNEKTGYIQMPYEYDTKSVNTLYGNALSNLQKYCEPAVTYEVEGYFDLNVGDAVSIADNKYNPILLLEARAAEMILSFCNPDKNKTVFSNYRVFESQVSSDLLLRMKQLEELANQLQFRINVEGSPIMKNGEGSVKLNAYVTQATKNVSDDFTEYNWIKRDRNGEIDTAWTNAHKDVGKTVTIIPADVEQSATFSYEVNVNGTYVGDATMTVANVYDGTDGKGIKSTAVTYQAGTNGTTPPTGNWLENPPAVSAGQYLWTKTEFVFDDETTSVSYSVGRMGQNGTSGVGVANTDVEYKASTSGTTPPTGTWSTAIPPINPGEYLWTRTTIKYTDESESVSYSVGAMGIDGTDAKLLYLTATAEQMSFDSDDNVKSQTITISAKLQNVTGTAVFTAIPYIGNTAQTPISLGGSGNNRTLTSSQFNKTWSLIAITATLDGLSDTLSIVKVKDGAKGDKGDQGATGPKGDPGSRGIAGPIGPDGRTSYVHYAYAWSPDGKDRFTATYPGENLIKVSNLDRSGTELPELSNGKFTITDKKSSWAQINNTQEFLTLGKWVTMSFKIKRINGIVDGLGGHSTIFESGTQDIYIDNVLQAAKTWSYANFSIYDTSVHVITIVAKVITFTGSTNTNLYVQVGRNNGYLNSYSAEIYDLKIEDGRNTNIIYTSNPNENYLDAYPTYVGTYTDFNEIDSQNPADYTWSRLIGEAGKDGKDGTNGATGPAGPKGEDATEPFSGYLTQEAIVLPANPQGVVSDFSKANGKFNTFEGNIGLSSGVTFTLVSQVGITSTINSSGNYNVTAISAETGMAIFRAVYKGIEVEKILMVVKARQGSNGAPGAKGDKGDTGNPGAKGDPTGITSSATAPSNPYVGMLWLNTGTSGGRVKNATYRWSGSSWGLYILTAENIVATNLAALSAYMGDLESGSIRNTGSYEVPGATINYETTIAGLIQMVWNVANSSQNGTFRIDPTGLGSYSYNDAAQASRNWFWEASSGGFDVGFGSYVQNNLVRAKLGPNGLSMEDSSFGEYGVVSLGIQDLMTISITTLTPASGYDIYGTAETWLPSAKRSVGRVIQLSGAFLNNSNIQSTTSPEIIGYLPVWARPSLQVNFIVQGSGINRFLLTVYTNGNIGFSRYGTTSNIMVPAGSWLNISCMYVAGNISV